jgi:hypothetical protein
MAMSEEHKVALAQGRKEARAIKAYLKALDSRRPGRPVTKEGLESRLGAINEKLNAADDPLRRIDLIQSRLDLEDALAALDDVANIENLEAEFVENAASYSERKGISYSAWREYGVPAGTLKQAGIAETRRR